MNTRKIQHHRTGLGLKSGIPITLVCNLIIFLFVSQVDGQVSEIRPVWKAHFKAVPVIKNCVFQRETPPITEGKFVSKGETNLYQFRYQENAFIIRQIRSMEDVNSNDVPAMGVCAGCYEKNCWAIDDGETLKLFPDGKYLTRTMPAGDGALLFSAERMLFSTLYFGINFLDPATVEWPGKSNFNALSIFGDKYVGQVVKTSQGNPTIMQFHSEKMPDRQFILEYKYDAQSGLDLNYFPTEIRLFLKVGGEKSLGAVYKILILKTSATPLEEDYFDYKRYFTQSTSPGTTKVFIFTNNQTFAVMPDGNLQNVLPSSMMPHIENSNAVPAHAKSTWFIISGIFVVSAAGFFFILKHKKQNIRTNIMKAKD